MSTAAAIAAQLVDIRNVGEHKCVKLTIHVPWEQALRVTDAFGWPTMAAPIPVALARLNQESGVTQSHPQQVLMSKAKRPWREIPAANQAGILCSDQSFWRFVVEEIWRPSSKEIPSEDAITIWMYVYFSVTSRLQLSSTDPRWQDLVTRYRAWKIEPLVVPT